MVTKSVNNESATKKVRFKHDLIAEIDASVEREKEANPKANFSAWVIDACEQKIEAEKSSKK
ncbi:DUF3950 domain-containing protein [Salmonella enterica]|uniref:YlcI/YnfO family protein n=1 Tax=Salmonella enterica TaxID=28901 RepID=UPI00126C900A|nr:YlcI/YnfO family protein [Salmonella enterica]EBM1967265.1 DUF3950 domain-containing protein [Salmonella enterica]EHB7345952.1 DUF3950 domain-containing protein [Salmonella enterica subsp. enterica serovar Bracknell]HAC7849347.1 DUF3950 domain-containing protein [Salmonella enterica]